MTTDGKKKTTKKSIIFIPLGNRFNATIGFFLRGKRHDLKK
jgi:hypothetical protein